MNSLKGVWHKVRSGVQDYFVTEQTQEDQNDGISVETKIVTALEATSLLQQLSQVMQDQKPYLDEDLKLKDLAMLLGTTDKKLSYVLNRHLGQSFYQYVNASRLKEFLQRQTQGGQQSFSIIGLAFDCGFKSKATFYRTFKRLTGVTPMAYARANSLHSKGA